MDSHNKSSEMMWQPDRNKVTKMDEFRSFVNAKYGLKIGEYVVGSVALYP